MKANNLTIIPPEGMEAYQDGSEIRFRPIKKNIVYYENVARKLFYDKLTYYIAVDGTIGTYHPTSSYYCAHNCTSNKQLRKLLAINKLMNVAKYLNGDNKGCEYYIRVDNNSKIDIIYYNYIFKLFNVGFKTKELAKQAIEILGEETIKLALCTDW